MRRQVKIQAIVESQNVPQDGEEATKAIVTLSVLENNPTKIRLEIDDSGEVELETAVLRRALDRLAPQPQGLFPSTR